MFRVKINSNSPFLYEKVVFSYTDTYYHFSWEYIK